LNERFTTTTTLRRPRTLLLWTVAGVMLALFVVSVFLRGVVGPNFAAFAQLPWWVAGPIIAAIQRRPKIESAAIEASPEGLRIGGALVPRARLTSALLRREQQKSWVTLRGRRAFHKSVDVLVRSDEEADRLCRALALDAASTTAEFTMFRTAPASRRRRVLAILGVFAALFVVGGAMTAAGAAAIPFLIFAPFALFAVLFFMVILSQRVNVRVGADGLVVREGLGRRKFIPHDEVEGVRAAGSSVVLTRKHGDSLTYSMGGNQRQTSHAADLASRAASVAWRIDKAREAYRALAGDAPQAALALDPGGRTAREWLEQLRRVGAGASATFRNASLTRDQLLGVIESTTAAAKARLAAAAALHDAITDEERPRIRVAAERCADQALGERMVRVAFAPSDEELEAELAEAMSLSADGERAAS
jgi:hypothetical protein